MADDAQNTWQPDPSLQQPTPIGIPVQDLQMGNPNGTGDDAWGQPADDRRRNGRSRSRSPGRGRDSSGQSNNPGNNLHVSGLSHKVDNRDLELAFGKYGRVQKASVMYDPHTKDSRGFAFVTMETPEEADAALTGLGGTELNGKVITVEKARRNRARTPTPGRYYGPPKRGGDRPYDPRPYDSRYRRDDDHRRYDDDRRRGSRYDDRDRDYDRDRYGGRDYGGYGRDHDRNNYDRRYDDRRY